MGAVLYRDPVSGTFKRLPVDSPRHSGLTGLADDDHPQYLTQARGDARYVQKTGDSMTGQLELREGGGGAGGSLMLHDPGVSLVRMRSGSSGPYVMRVERGDTTDPAPMAAGYPVHESHLATVQYAADVWAPRLSGPHGGESYPYYDVAASPGGPFPGGGIQCEVMNEPGIFKLTAFAYGHINGATATSNIYWSLSARWSDGPTGTFLNGGNVNFLSRLCVTSYQVRGYLGMYAEGWIQNRPGAALIYVGWASRDGTASLWQMGNLYRVSHEFWPYSGGDAGLSWGWGSW